MRRSAVHVSSITGSLTCPRYVHVTDLIIVEFSAAMLDTLMPVPLTCQQRSVILSTRTLRESDFDPVYVIHSPIPVANATNFYYRAACMQRGPSDRKSVCPSVCPSVRLSRREL